MPVEIGALFISQLVPTQPTGNEPKSEGDDHFRKIKEVLQNTFPTASRAFWLREWAERGAGAVVPNSFPYTPNITQAGSDNGKVIEVNAESAARTVTLPSTGSVPVGYTLLIRKTDRSSNLVTVSTVGADVIRGARTSLLLHEFNQCVELMAISGAWILLRSNSKGNLVRTVSAGTFNPDAFDHMHIIYLSAFQAVVNLPPKSQVPEGTEFDFRWSSEAQQYFEIRTTAPDVFSFGATQFRVYPHVGYDGIRVQLAQGAWRSDRRRFQTGVLAPPNADGRIVPHHLGLRPAKTGAFLECLISNNGYTAGQRVELAPTSTRSMYADATNLAFWQQGTLDISPAGGVGTINAISPNWGLRLWAEV